jgi:hypothetical protein
MIGRHWPPEHKLLPLAGIGLVMGATGSTVINYCELEATLLDSWGRRMTPWTRVMAVCEPGDWFPSGSVPRLDDPFTRLMLHTASAPDSSSNMYVCHKMGPLVNKWYTGCRSSPKPGAYVQAHSKPISNDAGSSGFNDTSHSTSNPWWHWDHVWPRSSTWCSVGDRRQFSFPPNSSSLPKTPGPWYESIILVPSTSSSQFISWIISMYRSWYLQVPNGYA